MENDMQVKYDHLCYAIFANVKYLAGDADRISFKNFNAKDEEHLCMLCVTIACLGILNKEQIALDCDAWTRRKLKKKYRSNCEICKLDEEDRNVIDVKDMLEFMRGPAKEMCGENFTFADIYNEYYKGDK